MLLALVLGLVIGLILALTGAGGAIVAVPLLMLCCGLDMVHAAPIALLAVAAAAAAGTLLGLRAGIVRYRAALLMAVAGIAAAPLGVLLAHRLPATPLALLFAGTLLFVALKMFRQAARALRGEADQTVPAATACRLSSETQRLTWNALCTRALLKAGLIAGFLAGLLGVGGGFALVAALRRSTDLSMNSVVATSLMVIALVSTSSVIASALAGRLNLHLALPFAGGAVVAMLAGRRLAARLAGPRLQQGFAVVAALVAVSLLLHQFL